MNAPAYISPLGSYTRVKQQEREMLEQRTQEFLNQGGKIEEVPASPSSSGQSSSYDSAGTSINRTTLLSRKARDVHVPAVMDLLSQGMKAANICRELGISHPTLQRIIKENNLDEFLRP